jgi:PAS domain S-box-containing protein
MSTQNITNQPTADTSNSIPHYFESIDLINRAIQESHDLEQMMINVLDTVLSVFDCDRAYLVYPCDPDAEFWRVAMERIQPEYPGANKKQALIPMQQDVARNMQLLREHHGPLTFGQGNQHPLGITTQHEISNKSFMGMAIYPKVDKPWQFGIHQCARYRTWSPSEVRLFQSIGRRLEDGLSLRLTLTELKKREENYSRIVNLASEGIWSVDASGKITSVNGRMSEILGYSTDEMRGRHLSDFLYDEDAPDYVNDLETLFSKTHKPDERCYRGKKGDRVWVSVSATGIHNEEGNFIGGFGMLSDITEKKRVESALHRLHQELEAKIEERTHELQVSHGKLEAAYRELKQTHASILHQEKMVSIGQLASGIAHEINTPSQYVSNNIRFLQETIVEILNSLQTCRETVSDLKNGETKLELLNNLEATLEEIDYDYLKEEIPQALKEAAQGVAQITNIVVAMMDFSKPSQNVPEPIDLTKLIENTLEICRDSWKRVAETVIEQPTEPIVVNGFKDELGQVVLHLILNAADAIEATHRGSDSLGRIRIQILRSKNWAEVVVEDTGCGMTPEIQHRVFEPFFTTKEVGRGSGQGLAIAYHIITDKHAGELLVDSSPNEGSTFTMRLPVPANFQ